MGFVTGEGIAVIDVALVEVPDGKVAGFGVTVELHGDRAVVWVGGDDSGEVAVEDPEPVLVFAAQDPVPSLEHPLPDLKDGSVELSRCFEVAAGLLVEFGDGVVVVGDE